MQFVDFEIEGSFNCQYDYLEVRDGDSENSTLVGKYCGDPNVTPEPVYSSLNYLWMRFKTDGSVSNRGFSINYTTTDAHCGGIIRDQSSGMIEVRMRKIGGKLIFKKFRNVEISSKRFFSESSGY